MLHVREKHARPLRWCHWINVVALAGMMWSGLLIYWTNDIYRIGYGDYTLFHFFPAWFYSVFNLKRSLAEGMTWHFVVMWLFAVNGIVYVTYTIVSGHWRELLPNRRSFREALQVLLHDLYLSKTLPPPRKFNGAQQIAYSGVVLMGLGSIVTGLAIYKPIQLGWLTYLLGGYPMARFEHFLLLLGYVLFIVVHLIQVLRAGWNNARSMITGYEIVAQEQQYDGT